MIVVWLASPGYLEEAVRPSYWLILGFLFLPTTTLAFAYASNSLQPAGEVPALGWLLIAIAMLIDLGLFGNGARSSRKRRKRDDDD